MYTAVTKTAEDDFVPDGNRTCRGKEHDASNCHVQVLILCEPYGAAAITIAIAIAIIFVSRFEQSL